MKESKKLVFLAINMLVTVLGLGVILGSLAFEDQKSKMIMVFTGIGIIIVQKIVEIIVIKETRKISIVVLIILIITVVYYLVKMNYI